MIHSVLGDLQFKHKVKVIIALNLPQRMESLSKADKDHCECIIKDVGDILSKMTNDAKCTRKDNHQAFCASLTGEQIREVAKCNKIKYIRPKRTEKAKFKKFKRVNLFRKLIEDI